MTLHSDGTYETLQILGSGNSHWVEVLFTATWSTYQEDGTSNTDGVGGYLPFIDWGDGTFSDVYGGYGAGATDMFFSAGIWRSHATGAQSEVNTWCPSHLYADPGTYTITLIADWIAADLPDPPNPHPGNFHSGAARWVLGEFVAATRAVPANTAPRQRMVLNGMHLNERGSDVRFEEGAVLLSAQFAALRSSSDVAMTAGFHGFTARTPWATDVGGYFAVGGNLLGGAGTDALMLTRTELDRVVDGGPSVDTVMSRPSYSPLGIAGASVAWLDTRPGDYLGAPLQDNQWPYYLSDPGTGSMAGPYNVPTTTWDPLYHMPADYSLTQFDPMQPVAFVNDTELLCQRGQRSYLVDVVSGDIWLALDNYRWSTSTVYDSARHWGGNMVPCGQADDGSLAFRVSDFAVPLGPFLTTYPDGLVVIDRSGIPINETATQLPLSYWTGSAYTTSQGRLPDDLGLFPTVVDALLDPGSSQYVYAVIFGQPFADRRDTAANSYNGPAWPDGWSSHGHVQYVTAVYRFDCLNPGSAGVRVGWLQHPYPFWDDGRRRHNNRVLWIYVASTRYGNIANGSWLPPPNPPMTVPTVRQRQIGGPLRQRQNGATAVRQGPGRIH